MNVNDIIMELENVTGLEVCPDIYDGSQDNYIVFTYASEQVELAADDTPEADTATIYVNLYTEQQFNFMSVKEQIKGYFESLDECTVYDVFTTTEEYKTNANTVKYKRHTVFEVLITKWR